MLVVSIDEDDTRSSSLLQIKVYFCRAIDIKCRAPRIFGSVLIENELYFAEKTVSLEHRFIERTNQLELLSVESSFSDYAAMLR